MFGEKNKAQQVTPPVKKEPKSWDDQQAAALPQKSAYFNAVRTDAYENQNLVSNYVEFWVALQVDRDQDKWRIMHYMDYDLDRDDGKFSSFVVSKEDCSFAEAMYHMSKFDSMAAVLPMHVLIPNMEEKFPADKHPELQTYFFDIAHYKLAANILHMAFDEAHHPYRTIEGKVFAASTFKRTEIVKAIMADEQLKAHPKVAAKIEAGILSDIYNAASGREATLENLLKAGEILAHLDSFAEHMAAFYLGIQQRLKLNDKLDKIQSLSPAEKERQYKSARNVLQYASGGWGALGVLSRAAAPLEQAKQLGAHVEPFEKHLAECELYAHLLDASINRSAFQASLESPNGADTHALQNVRESVKKAQDKFLLLGGTAEHFDRLQAWVANDKKEMIPSWVTRFLDRYYDARRRSMVKIQERKSSMVRDVNTMSAKVKPADFPPPAP